MIAEKDDVNFNFISTEIADVRMDNLILDDEMVQMSFF